MYTDIPIAHLSNNTLLTIYNMLGIVLCTEDKKYFNKYKYSVYLHEANSLMRR